MYEPAKLLKSAYTVFRVGGLFYMAKSGRVKLFLFFPYKSMT